MKYVMLIYGNEEIWGSLGAAEFPKLVAEVDAYNQALRDSGELVMVDGLVDRPRAFRAPEGVPVMSDGPYLEAKEYVGSMTVVDVESEERAIELAASYPGLKWGAAGGGVELWPLMDRGGADV